jgi:hypothetical protein
MIAPFLLVIGSMVSFQQSGASLHGRVLTAEQGTPLHDVRVVATPVDPSAGATRVTSSAEDGTFTFDGLPPGTYSVSATTVGFIFVRRIVEVRPNDTVTLEILLAEGTGTYRENVSVESRGAATSIEATSQQVLGSAALQDLRGIVTDDPLRAVQALPGVATGDDLRSDFSVRGSAFRQTGVVIDGTPTPLLLHTVRGEANTGSIAMINTDVLASATLSAGAHTRRHGDWMGATLEFDMREGSRDRLGMRVSVSGTAASVVGEGPVGREGRGSWIVAARRSYLDWLIRKVEPGFDSTLGFYDGYAKLVYDVTPRHQLQVMSVTGDATYRQSNVGRVNGLDRATSTSTLGSVLWRFTSGKAVVTNRLSLIGSDFRNTGVLGQELARGYTQSVLWRVDLTMPLGRAWTFEAGGLRERARMNEIARVFRPAQGTSITVAAQQDISPRTTLLSGWTQVSRHGASGGVTAGMRVSDRTISNRLALEPWLMAERKQGRFTWQGGVGATAQLPDAVFVIPGPDPIVPERGWGGDLGVAFQVTRTSEIRVAGFDREESDGLRLTAEDRLDPITGDRVFRSAFPEYAQRLDTTSRGVELVAARRSPTGLSGWIAYMWAHTRAVDDVTGERFDADFDQRHTLNAVWTQRLSYRTTVGAKLRLGSNMPIVGYLEGEPGALRLSDTRNGARLPFYARLDVRATRTFTFETRRLTLFVEVMNVLARDNYGQAEGSIRNDLQAVGYLERLIPLVPSAGILVEF